MARGTICFPDSSSASPTPTSRSWRTSSTAFANGARRRSPAGAVRERSEEHTSELQSRENLVCRLLLEKKKKNKKLDLLVRISNCQNTDIIFHLVDMILYP